MDIFLNESFITDTDITKTRVRRYHNGKDNMCSYMKSKIFLSFLGYPDSRSQLNSLMDTSDIVVIIVIMLFVTALVVFFAFCLCQYFSKGIIEERRKRQRDKQQTRTEVDRLFRGWGESQNVDHSSDERSGGITQNDSISRNYVSTIQTPIIVHSTDYNMRSNHGSLYYNSHLLPTQVNRSRSPSPARFPKPTAPSDESSDLPPSYDFAIHNSIQNLDKLTQHSAMKADINKP